MQSQLFEPVLTLEKKLKQKKDKYYSLIVIIIIWLGMVTFERVHSTVNAISIILEQ